MQLEEILQDLNEDQLSAVVASDGPALVFAGAGSGKTKVLTSRIAYLLITGKAQPSEICALTFTNKAAREMRERLEKLVDIPLNGIWIGTFHALAYQILLEYPHEAQLMKNFSILDEADARQILEEKIDEYLKASEKLEGKEKPQLLKSMNDVERRLLITKYLSLVKDLGMDYEEDIQAKRNGEDSELHEFASIYEGYQTYLLGNNAVDFDDLIFKVVKFFNESKDAKLGGAGYTKYDEIRKAYYNKYKYVLIDEYQDTSVAQYHFGKFLSSKTRNLMVVGDDDQSIYGWRNADIRNIRYFKNNYPDAQVITLRKNYRSTQVILDAAYGVVKNNTNRQDKKLIATRTGNEPVHLILAENETHEAMAIANEIKRMMQDNSKLKYHDFAVLYRVNSQAKVLEEILVQQGIPYTLSGGTKFFARKEIKGAVAYLQSVANPDNSFAFRRVLETVPRIGEKTAQLLENLAAEKQTPILYAANDNSILLRLPTASREPLQKISFLLQDYRKKMSNLSIYELFNGLMQDSGYEERIKTKYETVMQKLTEGEVKRSLLRDKEELEKQMDNYNMLKNLIENSSVNTSEEDIAMLLNNQIIDDNDKVENKEVKLDAVSLTTVHQSKGLEYTNVFVIGMEEGSFPSQRAIKEGISNNKEQEAIEEERRLAYVAITRAKDKIYLSAAKKRKTVSVPGISRFVREVPRELLRVQEIDSMNKMHAKMAQERYLQKRQNLVTEKEKSLIEENNELER